MKNDIKMENMFYIKDWEIAQESISKLTDMAILMTDYKGKPLSKHSGCSDFCKKIRSDEILGQYCQKCDSRGAAESVIENKPYIYKCCFGLVDIAVPIIFENTYLGSIMIGQVKTNNDDLEKILSLPTNKFIYERLKDFKKDYDKIKTMDFSKINMISYMVYDICHYIINDKSYKRINIFNNDNKELLSYGKENKIITKAKEYIKNQFKTSITLRDVAKHCNVSSSYLSRLFIKETGESFSIYISKIKIEKAKELLEFHNMSINDIGYELGFNEIGYFIKVFKKNVGMTPGTYRKYRVNS